ncbi:hypothetical protein MTO96_008364 [Rhipicephalus appendiculatus]
MWLQAPPAPAGHSQVESATAPLSLFKAKLTVYGRPLFFWLREARPSYTESDRAVSAPQLGTSRVANTEFIVGSASLGESTAAEPADCIDTTGHVVAEFILNSSVDEALGLPEELIYDPSHEQEQHTAPSPERTQNEVGATAKCKDATVQEDAENLASVADQDRNGAGTLCLGAAAADTLTRVLFEAIDGQDAATKIFSTAGPMGDSVTGRPSNRTKGDPKPALDRGKLSALKGRHEREQCLRPSLTIPDCVSRPDRRTYSMCTYGNSGLMQP